MVAAILSHEPVTANDTDDYANGVKHVPAYVLTPIIVDKNDFEQTLIRSGYYYSKIQVL
jgi:putative multiple sugar transport system substrate-binding protein